jgi:hypothetical protein
MSFPPDPPGGWQEEVEYFPSPSDIRESLAAAPVPKEPKFYDLSEAEFWRRRHVPPGSTLVFKDPSQGEGPDVPDAAVLVLETESLQEGIWLTVKGIGASTEEEKKKVMGYFKSKKRKIHLCYRKPQECFQDEHEGLHLSKFHWYPPGDLTASWLTAHGRKAVADGKALAAKTTTDPADEKRKEAHGAWRERGGNSAISPAKAGSGESLFFRISGEARTSTGRRTPHGGWGWQVWRAPQITLCGSGPLGEEGSGRNTQRHCIRGQQEEQAEEEDNGRFAPESSSSHKEKKKKSRSRSRSRRRRKKRRHSSESESGEGLSRDSSSSEGSMMAPLKKKSRKTPGSVFQMLEEQAIEQLSADGILEED